MKLSIDLDTRPQLKEYIKTNPANAKEFMGMLLDAANDLVAMKFPMTLVQDTAKQLSLRPADLFAGIIAGCLNEQLINEKMAHILGKDILPVAILTLKGLTIDGDELYADWRRWFGLEHHAELSADTIAKVIAGIMKYARFLDFDKFSEAIESNSLIAFKGLAHEQVKLLPFIPALRYQREQFGDFKVGKFFPDRQAGFFDCGEIGEDEQQCLACGRMDLQETKNRKYKYCKACNAGYTFMEVIEA